MSPTIPDLWPDDIRVDVLTPLMILRTQEGLLSRKTQGILEAKVITNASDNLVEHQLDLIAPALNRYRVTLLTARHQRNMVYPVTVQAACFAPRTPLDSLAVPMIVREANRLAEDEREAASQEQFIGLIQQVLRSGEVRAVIDSLIARSNEGHPPANRVPAGGHEEVSSAPAGAGE